MKLHCSADSFDRSRSTGTEFQMAQPGLGLNEASVLHANRNFRCGVRVFNTKEELEAAMRDADAHTHEVKYRQVPPTEMRVKEDIKKRFEWTRLGASLQYMTDRTAVNRQLKARATEPESQAHLLAQDSKDAKDVMNRWMKSPPAWMIQEVRAMNIRQQAQLMRRYSQMDKALKADTNVDAALPPDRTLPTYNEMKAVRSGVRLRVPLPSAPTPPSASVTSSATVTVRRGLFARSERLWICLLSLAAICLAVSLTYLSTGLWRSRRA